MTASNFTIVDNKDGTHRIECLFVVYREKFGYHPDFLQVDEERVGVVPVHDDLVAGASGAVVPEPDGEAGVVRP